MRTAVDGAFRLGETEPADGGAARQVDDDAIRIGQREDAVLDRRR